MTTLQALTVRIVISDARRARNKTYSAYEHFKAQIAALGLNADEYEQAVRKVAKVLGV